MCGWALKISVESIDESMMVSKYNIHNSKIRQIGEEKAKEEIMLDYNDPYRGEANKVWSLFTSISKIVNIIH